MVATDMVNDKIDFVITWVDDSDPVWLEKKNIYSTDNTIGDSKVRYRNWEILRYWFRSVEQFAPWVNKIYFIVDNQYPKWLDISNQKLIIVNHEDFIPKEYLPTFNSRTIELNMHRIKGLSEKFVYFNDDMFLNSLVSPQDFFQNNLPVDIGAMSLVTPNGNSLSPVLFNNMEIINRKFNQRKAIKKNFSKYFNFRYGSYNLRSLFLLPWPFFLGYRNTHLPLPFLKSSFCDIWEYIPDECDKTCKDKFRTSTGINLWIVKYWQLSSARFVPGRKKFGKYFELTDDSVQHFSDILNSKYKVFCINDTDENTDFELSKKFVISEFEKKLDRQSAFEKKEIL